jgi:hypothetical protein
MLLKLSAFARLQHPVILVWNMGCVFVLYRFEFVSDFVLRI